MPPALPKTMCRPKEHQVRKKIETILIPIGSEKHVKAVGLVFIFTVCFLVHLTEVVFLSCNYHFSIYMVSHKHTLTFSISLWQQTWYFFKCMLDCYRIKFQPIKNLGIFHLSATCLRSVRLHSPGVVSRGTKFCSNEPVLSVRSFANRAISSFVKKHLNTF